jgi:alanine transaminase
MDGVPEPKIEDIFLTEGASQGVHVLLNTLILDSNDAIMIPIPQYPLYTASISLSGGVPAPYYLNESSGWQLDIEELERSIQ